MFDALIKVIEIVFKPLLDTSKEAIQKSSDPKRKMTRSLIKLYDELEAIEYWSEKLLNDAETYISRDWAAWTVARNKRDQLIRSAKELRKATLNLGESLSELYTMLSIHHRELLIPLVGLHGLKRTIIAEGIAAPAIINVSDDPKVGALKLLQPKTDMSNDEIVALCKSLTLNSGFRFDSNKIDRNYLLEIDIDNNKVEIAEIIKSSRQVLVHIDKIKTLLRDFIQKNMSIEDFFK